MKISTAPRDDRESLFCLAPVPLSRTTSLGADGETLVTDICLNTVLKTKRLKYQCICFALARESNGVSLTSQGHWFSRLPWATAKRVWKSSPGSVLLCHPRGHQICQRASCAQMCRSRHAPATSPCWSSLLRHLQHHQLHGQRVWSYGWAQQARTLVHKSSRKSNITELCSVTHSQKKQWEGMRK